MKTKTNQKPVKTYIKQLIRKLGGRKEVARTLGITERYVYMLEYGEKIPSDHLRKLIKMVLK